VNPIRFTMDTAITALDTIYSTILDRECSSDVLKTFQENLGQMKAEWTRKKRIEGYVRLLREGGLDEWRRLHKEAHADYQQGYATGNYRSLMSLPADHPLPLINESWACFEAEEKERLRKETELTTEAARLKQRDDELLEEARRRVAAAKREEDIQALMASLTEKTT
jgi:hypothetical protein